MTFHPSLTVPKETGETFDLKWAIKSIIRLVGEDPNREGLKDTPDRVIRAWKEMTKGYGDDPEQILAKRFEHQTDEIVVLRSASFASICEHHMLPFTGRATIGYLPQPGAGVVGLSKLARLLDCYAHRLQLQERLTQEITSALDEHLQPLGAGCLISAVHTCMAIRGVRKDGAEMVTSSLTGAFREDPNTRAEFLALARQGS